MLCCDDLLRRLTENDPTCTHVQLLQDTPQLSDTATVHTIAKALTSNTHVTDVHVACPNLTNDGAVSIIDAVRQSSSVIRFTFCGSPFGPKVHNALDLLLRRNDTVSMLGLQGNDFGDAGALTVANGLRHNKSIMMLNLAGNGIGPEGAVALASTLQEQRNKSSLMGIWLHENHIGNVGAAAIALALRKNDTLTELYLDNNGIGDEGAVCIARALEGNTTLHCLYANANDKIGSLGIDAFTKALQYNHTVTDLVLGDDHHKHISSLKQIESYVTMNRRGPIEATKRKTALFAEHALFREEVSIHLYPSALRQVEERCGLDAIYGLVRGRPDLVRDVSEDKPKEEDDTNQEKKEEACSHVRRKERGSSSSKAKWKGVFARGAVACRRILIR